MLILMHLFFYSCMMIMKVIGAFALSLRTANGGISWDYLFIDDDEFRRT